MLARVQTRAKSLFSFNRKQHSFPLETGIPETQILEIISGLPLKERTYIAQTNKAMRKLVESVPTGHDIIRRNQQPKAGSYAEINEVLNKRVPIERRLQRIDKSWAQPVHEHLGEYLCFIVFLESTGVLGDAAKLLVPPNCTWDKDCLFYEARTSLFAIMMLVTISTSVLYTFLDIFVNRQENTKQDLLNQLNDMPSISPRP